MAEPGSGRADGAELRGRGGGGWSFREYMTAKVQKLAEQHVRDEPERQSDLFKGITIYVNGFTEPPAEDLKRLMQVHGGSYTSYYSRRRVTHIIASNLCGAKIKDLGIAAGKRLATGPYQIYHREGPDQARLGLHASSSAHFNGTDAADTAVPPRPTLAVASQPEPSAEAVIEVSSGSPPVQERPATPVSEAHERRRSWAERTQPSPAQRDDRDLLDLLSRPPSLMASPQPLAFPRPPSLMASPQPLAFPRPPPEVQKPLHKPTPQASLPAVDEGERSRQVPSEAMSTLPPVCEAYRTGGTLAMDPLDVAPPPRLPSELPPLVASSTAGAASDLAKYGTLVSGNNPNFMEQFYQQSRLHLLSTSANEAKSFVRRLQQEHLARGGTLRPFSAFTEPGRVIVHIDLDAFFVSVSLREHSELAHRPVVIAHSKREGSSEISSCNYVARDRGVRNGMSMRRALAICPELQALPYEFEKYKTASQAFYNVLTRHTLRIQAVSMDEAYLDLTGDVLADYNVAAWQEAQTMVSRASTTAELAGSSKADTAARRSIAPRHHHSSTTATSNSTSPATTAASELVERLRKEVFDAIGVTASAGIGPSPLLARLSTRKAKPNGLFSFKDLNAERFVEEYDIESLPGVGWSTAARLRSMKITDCRALRQLSLAALQDEFGPKIGASLFQTCRGLDTSTLKDNAPPKSVSVEISWGVRFDREEQVLAFVEELALEVTKRLVALGRRGTRVTLKIKQRKPDAGAPYKMLGHGPCDDRNRSVPLPHPTDDAAEIASACQELTRALAVPPLDVRGVGITITGLTEDMRGDNAGPNVGPGRNVVARPLTSFFSAEASHTSLSAAVVPMVKPSKAQPDGRSTASREGRPTERSKTPSAAAGDEIDMSVLAALPPELRAEVEAHYSLGEQAAESTAVRKPAEPAVAHKPTSPPKRAHRPAARPAAKRPAQGRSVMSIAEEPLPFGIRGPRARALSSHTCADGKAVDVAAASAAAANAGATAAVAAVAAAAVSTAAAAMRPEDDFISPSQWNPDVLSELPAELVAEVTKEARAEKKRRLRQAEALRQTEEMLAQEGFPARAGLRRAPVPDPMPPPDSVPKATLAAPAPPAPPAPPAYAKQRDVFFPLRPAGPMVQSLTGLPALLGCTGMAAWRAVLHDWVCNNYTGASPEKGEAIADLLLQLCLHKRLDDAQALLRGFRRHAVAYPSAWSRCFDAVLARTQQAVLESLGATLPVDPIHGGDGAS